MNSKPLYTMIAIAGVAFGVFFSLMTEAKAEPNKFARDRGVDFTRACIPKSGVSKRVSVSAVSASTPVLSPRSVHELSCDIDVHNAMGDGVPATATTNHQRLAEGVTIYFMTFNPGTSDFVSFIKVSGSDGNCWIRECM